MVWQGDTAVKVLYSLGGFIIISCRIIQALSLTPQACYCKQIYRQAKQSEYTAVFAFSPDQVKIRDIQTNVNIHLQNGSGDEDIFSHARGTALRMAILVCHSTTLVQAKICQQLFDRSHVAFMMLRGWILLCILLLLCTINTITLLLVLSAGQQVFT